MKSISKTFQLPVMLVELAKLQFNTANASQAIRMCMETAIMHNIGNYPNITAQRHHLLTIAERKKINSYTIRIEDWLLQGLSAILDSKCDNDVLILAMLFTIDRTWESNEVPFPNATVPKFFNVLGSKWDKRLQSAIRQIINSAGIDWKHSIETCAGSLGILSNFQCAETEIINDDDADKVNLFLSIKNHACEFKCKCLQFDCSKENFEQLKTKNLPLDKKCNVDRAVQFFLLNFFSHRNTGHTFNEKTPKTLLKRLDSVLPLSERLKTVTITEKDIFDVIKKYRKEGSALFFVDPIYLDANVYQSRVIRTTTSHGTGFGWQEHERLAKELGKIKGNFIYFCRTTVSRRKDKHGNLIDTSDTLRNADIELHGKIDDLYWGRGFYYLDVPMDNGTIERIITNFLFDGSTYYGERNEREVM